MGVTMFTVDGVAWQIPCDIRRVVDVHSTDLSGYMMDGSYNNDVDGTYLSYRVKLVAPTGMADRYHDLFERITEPVSGHAFVFPYNNSTVSIVGRVSDIADVWRFWPGGGKEWTGLEFTVTANNPTRRNTLGQVLTMGRPPMPDVAEATEGDTYVYTNGAWLFTVYGDGDNTYY